MKKIMILPLLFLTANLIGQSASLSTFEEMWIVSPEFLNLEASGHVSLAPESMTYEKLNSVKSFGDLNKIIADTPFLSITMVKASKKFEKESKENSTPMIRISDRYQAGTSLKGWGSWMVLFQKGDEFVIGIPTNKPEELKAYLQSNNVVINDKMGKFSTMTIKEIRIENGTYGKTR